MELTKPCNLIWTNLDKNGYATTGHNHLKRHRLVLAEKLGRPIREGFECCHYCDTPNCIEPEHLYEGTHSQNMQEAFDKGRKQSGWAIHNLAKDYCPKGHPYEGDNLYVSNGKRYCRECKREEQRARRKARFI